MHVNNPLLTRPEPPHERAGLSTSAPDRSTLRALLGRSRSRDGWRCSCHPGSATRGVQIGFATCLVLFILGYAALAGPSWAPLSSSLRATPGGASLTCMTSQVQCTSALTCALADFQPWTLMVVAVQYCRWRAPLAATAACQVSGRQWRITPWETGQSLTRAAR